MKCFLMSSRLVLYSWLVGQGMTERSAWISTELWDISTNKVDVPPKKRSYFVKNCKNEINFTKNSGNTFKISRIEAQNIDLRNFSEKFGKWNFVDTVLPQQVSLHFKTKYGIETHTKFYLRIGVKTNFFCSKRPKKGASYLNIVLSTAFKLNQKSQKSF